jgi:hypothetical protein
LEGTKPQFAPRRHRAALFGACAVGAVGVVGAFSSLTGAQGVPVAVEPVSVTDGGTQPVAAFNSRVQVSDTGGVAVFESATDPAGTNGRVWIRDRVAGTSTPTAERRSAAPGISGNGCVVAFSVPGVRTAATNVSLAVVDRCAVSSGAALPSAVVLDTVVSGGAFAAPALSFDGSTIVWSTGSEIRRYVRPTTQAAHVRTASFDSALTATAGAVTAGDVDVSDDGATVAFVAGPGSTPFAPAPANVYVWSAPDGASASTIELMSPTADGTPGAATSGSPSLSSDGSLVVFGSTSTDLAAVGADPVVAPFVVSVDRTTRATKVLIGDARRPVVSGDGQHVAYERATAVRMLSSTSGASFSTSTDRPIDGLDTAGPASRVAMSRFGRWVLFDSGDGTSFTDSVELQEGVMVWAADLRVAADGSIADTTTTTTTTTTPPTTTPTPTVTTTTVPGTVGRATPVVIPRTPTRPVVRVPTFSGSSTTSRRFSTAGVGGDSSEVSLVVEPQSVTFQPTIVDAGRSTSVVSLTNVGGSTATVGSVRLEPTTAYSIADDGCTGTTLGAGATCTVEVSFAPVEVGANTGTISFDISDGTVAEASLLGDGAAEPTLGPVPAVATPGQVVTVFGGGFPAGAVVQLARPGTSEVDEISVDVDGTFAHVFVVLPRTPSGPMTLTVTGQTDLFDDVTTELLVSGRGTGSGAAPFRDGVGNPFGR